MKQSHFALMTTAAALAVILPLAVSAQESAPPATVPAPPERTEPAPPPPERMMPVPPPAPGDKSTMAPGARATPAPGVSGTELASAINSDNLIGKRVRNSAGETIGQIDSILMSKDARVIGVVLDVGGFLGVGGHKVVVPMEQFSLVGDNDIRLPNGSKEQLRQEPAYEKPRG